jgi:hypothetical protein
MNNHNLSNCVFITKESWFNNLYFSNENIMNQIQQISMIEYQQIIKKINSLKLKQETKPIESREVLIHLKELQKIIFENQFSQLRDYYFIRRQLLYIKNNPQSDLHKPIIIRNKIFKKKIGLLSSIYEMERSLCQLELTHKLSLNRNSLNVQLRNNENPKFDPKLRKLLRNWVNAINQSNITLNKINNLAKNLKNINKKNEFGKIWKNLKKNNFNTFLRFKKKYLKTEKCRFAIQERTPNEKSEFLHNLESKPIIPWETILKNIGLGEDLGSLSFLNEHPLHKRAIIELLNLYLMPITEPFDDIFRLKREYYLMCISFILLDFNMENINYLPEAEGTSGFTAQTRINISSSSIYKVENLRLSDYPKSSYMSSIYLFSFFIQKYLYNLKNENDFNKTYVPDIENIYYHFTANEEEKKRSITKMNLARRNTNTYRYSINLQQLLIRPIEKNGNTYFFEINNFEEFIIEILKKICDILIFYQKNCYFVHRDFHVSNVMINFNIINNNFDLSNFQVKIIDFTFSSIIIPNKKGDLSELMYSNLNYWSDITPSNPYINKNWKCFDLSFFIITLLLDKLYNGNINNLNNNILINSVINSGDRIKKLKNIRTLLLNICGIQKNYLAKYYLFKSNYIKNSKRCINDFINFTYSELLFNPIIFKNILGDNCDILIFNPNNFLLKLKNFNDINNF